jgi:hypothetical protein
MVWVVGDHDFIHAEAQRRREVLRGEFCFNPVFLDEVGEVGLNEGFVDGWWGDELV